MLGGLDPGGAWRKTQLQAEDNLGDGVTLVVIEEERLDRHVELAALVGRYVAHVNAAAVCRHRRGRRAARNLHAEAHVPVGWVGVGDQVFEGAIHLRRRRWWKFKRTLRWP